MVLTEEVQAVLNYEYQILSELHDHLHLVNRFPHEGQFPVLKAFFDERKKVIMGQCGRSHGKALALDTPILTSQGWSTMGALEVGDFVFGADGKQTRVVGASEVLLNRDCYKVRFIDGSEIVADAEHRWVTTTKRIRKSQKRNRGRMPNRSPLLEPQVFTTKQILDTLKYRDEANHFITNTEAIFYEASFLPVPPYVLGVWLGDGSSSCGGFYTNDDEMVSLIEGFGFRCVKSKEKFRYGIIGLEGELRKLNLLRNKHIPDIYLQSSIEQRKELLAGLLDTDGSCSNGNVEFVATNERLAYQTKFLAESLGMKVTVCIKKPVLNGVVCADAYRIRICPRFQLFKLSRKVKKLEYYINKGIRGAHHRSIISIEKCESVPVRCISVDNKDKLYLAGNSLIPTHNTEEILYITWRYALTHPQHEVYIICPEVKQARKIYWFKKRLQTYGPSKFVKDIRESENRVVFFNDAYIIIDGCENYEALRGIKPNLVIYDEFQHHSNQFDEEVMQPNLSAGDVSLVVMGTPPKRTCYYVEFREKLLDNVKKGNPKYFYVELPTSANPLQDSEWLAEKKAELVAQGKLNVWLREYEGKLVFDIDGAIFPQFRSTGNKSHVKSHKFLLNILKNDRKKLEWYAIYDPGTTTCFAVLFAAINRYTAQVYILDEIYEQRKEETLASKIWPRGEKVKEELYDELDDWQNFYDEAAPSFALDVQDRFNVAINKTQKVRRRSQQDSRPGEDLIKTLFDEDRIFISDRCEKWIWEFENYVMVDGKYPKYNDHLVDCTHYLILESRLSLNEAPDVEAMEERRNTGENIGVTHPLTSHLRKQDILYGVEVDEYDYEGDFSW